MSISRRQEYTEATRRALLDSAAAAFVAKGYADTSVEDVARGARLTKGAVYHHFSGGKRELFRAVLEEVREELGASLRAAETAEPDPWRRLLAGVGAFLDACMTERYRRIALEEAPAALGWDFVRELDSEYARALFGPLAGLIDAGVIRPEPVELLARVVLAAIGAAGRAVAGASDRKVARREAQALLEQLLSGLRTA
ncbi:MAG: TetR family transcriptional regulator [Candidatus Dormibacteraeota bacterium]|nr:TetR family transcriptional regulator [Candidatus Dormibacteraeota bacterium]